MEKISEFRNLRKIVHKIYCDDCNIELQSGDRILTTYPPQYIYNCPQCHKEYTLRQSYPWMEIVGDEVNEDGICISL